MTVARLQGIGKGAEIEGEVAICLCRKDMPSQPHFYGIDDVCRAIDVKQVKLVCQPAPYMVQGSGVLLHKLEPCPEIMEESGMDGCPFPEIRRKPLAVRAVEAMREMIMESEEKITLVTIAALTNVSILFKLYPEVKERIDEIVMMGGGIFAGNTNSVAEFNIYNDPYAAAIVFQSGVKINMIGLDVTEKALLHKDNILRMRDSGRDGEMLYSLFENYRGGSIDTGLMIHDACTIAFMMKPELFCAEEKYVEVVTEGIAAGALVTDTWVLTHADMEPNVNVCMDVDAEAFEEWFVQEFYK